jgi:glycerol-1-phosphate dehydrogenase [NAD(P)+]
MFDKSTWIRLPRNVVVGHGMLDELGDAVGELYLSGTPLIVTSPSPDRIVGDRVRDQLPDSETVVVGEAGFD